MRPFITALVMLSLAACQKSYDISDIQVENLEGEKVQIDLKEHKATVFYFLSPECPLCQNYTLAFRELHEEFTNQGVAFYGIYPGEWYSASEIKAFKLKYKLPVTMLIDPNMEFTNELGATVTPEAYLFTADGKLKYSGKIDNWVNALGKKKLEVTETYLKDAILATLDGKEVQPKQTEPIGCLIE